MQWPSAKAQNDVKNTIQKIKDQSKRTPLKTGDEPRCFGKVILWSSRMVKPKTAILVFAASPLRTYVRVKYC